MVLPKSSPRRVGLLAGFAGPKVKIPAIPWAEGGGGGGGLQITSAELECPLCPNTHDTLRGYLQSLAGVVDANQTNVC